MKNFFVNKFNYIFNNPIKSCLILCFSVCAVVLNSTYADNFSLFREIVKVNSRVNSLDADIIQYIITPDHSKETFKGKYRADKNGRFRIDYTTPSRQIVLNDGKSIYWYYPDVKILYKIGSKDRLHNSSKINPLNEFTRDFKRNFQLNYLGKHLYGFFKIAHQFVLEDKKRGLVTDIWVDTRKKVILAKIVKDREGREIIKELYGGYKRIGKIYFPSRIDVYARSIKGVSRNTTEYNNVHLNYRIPERLFKIKFPKDIKIRYLKE